MTDQAIPNPLAVLKPIRRPKVYTLDEYLQKSEKSDEKYEYFDGLLKHIPMAKGPHNEISANVISAIKFAVKTISVPYRIFSSDQKVYLPTLNYGLYPDALVVSEKPIYWDENEVLLINPLLIVEVLSKSTRNYDQIGKFAAYKTLPSFKEYVMIDQEHCRVETWFREEPDLWRETISTDLTAGIALKSIGIKLLLADIYEHIALK